MLFFADILQIGSLPEEFEMVELEFLDKLPEAQTYPEIYPHLFLRIQGWMNLQSSPEELWDVYDENRKLTGRLHQRGKQLTSGDYHLVVHVWMQNDQGQFLLTKRSPNKGFPNMWESTGGSAIAGDNSLAAALREVKEELGISLSEAELELLDVYKHKKYFMDIYVVRKDVEDDEIILDENEVINWTWASESEIEKLIEAGKMVHSVGKRYEMFGKKLIDNGENT